MQISKGVEWAVHACALMGALPPGKGLKAEALARYHEVPQAYMAKQLQTLSRAGLVHSSRGAHGGYRLARAMTDISLADILTAIEGRQPAFRCTEIRQNGPCAAKPGECRKPCAINAAFLAAERVYRAELSAVSLADIAVSVLGESVPDHLAAVADWVAEEAVPLTG